MSRAKRIVACALTVAMVAGLLSGCTTFDNFKKAFLNKNPDNDAQIKIGVYEPMTGEDKEAGAAEVEGLNWLMSCILRLQVQEWNCCMQTTNPT